MRHSYQFNRVNQARRSTTHVVYFKTHLFPLGRLARVPYIRASMAPGPDTLGQFPCFFFCLLPLLFILIYLVATRPPSKHRGVPLFFFAHTVWFFSSLFRFAYSLYLPHSCSSTEYHEQA
ncbi:hypothetical protein C8J57DRAFT_285005 [Mycena rebaudengoi]|nr:hypothetical protein C8J57DRAFT_285005 [Mycena rebaudengoi]